jgi:hypothetical protein
MSGLPQTMVSSSYPVNSDNSGTGTTLQHPKRFKLLDGKYFLGPAFLVESRNMSKRLNVEFIGPFLTATAGIT